VDSPPKEIDQDQNPPFEIRFAPRVYRLPPYLFARINSLLYQKRRAGKDVIDLGMGNPSDPPQDIVIQKLAEAAADPSNHGYSKSNGIINLRREVASKYLKRYGVRVDPETEVIVCLGSKEGFSHMCLALMGPGDTAIVPAPYFPVHTHAIALAAGNTIALEVADSEKFLSTGNIHTVLIGESRRDGEGSTERLAQSFPFPGAAGMNRGQVRCH
jgi:alanine-synthesizing transaminase